MSDIIYDEAITVADLIEKLTALPADMKVFIDHSESLSIAPLRSLEVQSSAFGLSSNTKQIVVVSHEEMK